MNTKKRNRSRKPSPTRELVGVDVPRLVMPLPSDDTIPSVKARMKAVVNGHYEALPGLAEMSEIQMRQTLQDLWTLCDECGVQRRNSDGPHSTELVIYGRVYGAIEHGPIIRHNAERTRGGNKD